MEIDGVKVKSVEITLETYKGLKEGNTGSPLGELETLKILKTALKEGVPIFIKDETTGKRYKTTD
jgi:hypothetical protein